MPFISRRQIVVIAAAAVALPVSAQNSPGAPAVVADTADDGGPGGAAFFLVKAINGEEVTDTAMSRTFRASAGRGAYMVMKGAERPVPSGKVTLTLRGIEAHAAPINTLFKAIFSDGNPEVTGSVTVELAPGMRYRANGVLDGFKREIWLEDAAGVEVPGSKLATPPDPEMVRQMEGAAFAATNLRYEGDWISEVSWLQLPFVPVGSRIKVLDYGSNKASVLVDGRKMRMGIDWSRGKETIEQFVARATVTEDPRKTIAAYPARVRTAIRSGRVFVGMTKEQVLYAVGRPRVDFVPLLSANEWKYQVPDQEEMFLVFDEAGALKEVDGSRKARKFIVFEAE